MSLKYLDSISLNSRMKIEAAASLRNVKKGVILAREGVKNNTLLFLVSGYASIYRDSRFGRDKIIFVSGHGELLNETNIDYEYNVYSIRTLSDSQILEIKVEDYFRLAAEDEELMKALYRSLSAKTRRLYHQLGNANGTNPLENRLMIKIWKLAKNHGIETHEGIKIPFDVSVTFLANMLGAKRESVSRCFSKIKDEGLIISDNKTVIVSDMDKLRNRISENV